MFNGLSMTFNPVLAALMSARIVPSFDPLTLFAAGEPGVWYDPSDFSTMFQDAAGTVPVTAVEQPVGLILDKSKGLTLGPELVVNGDFSNGTTGWGFIGASSLVVVSGVGRLTTDGSGSYPQINQYLPTLAAGVPLRVAGTISNNNTGRAFRVVIFNLTDNITQFDSGVPVTNGAFSCVWSDGAAVGKSYRLILIATGTASAGLTADFDNISVRELPGNHAYQTTATSRPVLSSRVNLLTKTEQFDDAVWVKNGATVTANTTIAPDGTTTADTITATSNFPFVSQDVTAAPTNQFLWRYSIQKTTGLADGSFPTVSIEFRTSSTALSEYGAVVNTNTGQIVAASGWGTAGFSSISVVNEGSYWTVLATTSAAPASTTIARVYIGISGGFANGTRRTTAFPLTSVVVWGASLVPANQAHLPYQRVNTSTDYDSDPAKFPRYLRFDGVDDWLVTNTITPGIDKVQVFAGVRKLSDAAAGMLLELGTGAVSGNFQMLASGQAGDASRRTWVIGHEASGLELQGGAATFPAPDTRVLTGSYDRAGTVTATRLQLRLNTAPQSLVYTAFNPTTGNYLAYPLYIGRRGSATLPFNGHLYSMIVRFGSNLPAATIGNTEKYINTKTRAY